MIYGSRSFLRVLLVLAVALFTMATIVQCTQNINLTHEAKYLEALTWYNDNLEIYLGHYRQASPETQAEWKEKYHPIFIAGDQALRSWKLALPAGDAVEKEKVWMEAKRQILASLVSLGFVEIKTK
jgi:hypothetical protein